MLAPSRAARTAIARRIQILKDSGAFLDVPDLVSYQALGFDIDAFSPTNANVDAVHHVSGDIQIGASNFQLKAGDLLISVDNAEDLVGNSVGPDAGFTNSLSVDNQHVFVFRPDMPGDYSTGSFAIHPDELR